MHQIRRQFTLYELAIVIVALAIIAAIVLPNVTGRTADAKVTALKQDLAHIEQAIMQQEMEEPEAEVLMKVAADEISPTLKASVEKNLKDDASEMYRVDMKKLKPYLLKTKYGHLDDQEDEFFFSKKTGLAYYEKGISPSKGQRVHFLGERPIAEKPSAVLPILNKVKKVYATPAAVYYLMENGDLYGEGYNFYGSLFNDKDIMTEKNAAEGTLVYQQRKKIAEKVKSLSLPPIISIKNATKGVISAYITEDDKAHVYALGKQGIVQGEIEGVDHIKHAYVFYTNKTVGAIDIYDVFIKSKFGVTQYDIPYVDVIGQGVFVDKDGNYVGVPTPSDPNDVGKDVTLVRTTLSLGPLFKIGEGLYRSLDADPKKRTIAGEKVIDSDKTMRFVSRGSYNTTELIETYQTTSGKLYLEDTFVDNNVSTHYLLSEGSLIYQKSDKVLRFDARTNTTTSMVDNVKTLKCGGSILVYGQTFCTALTKDNKLYIGMMDEPVGNQIVNGSHFRLGASGVSSFTMNETHEYGDVVFYKDALGATHIVRDNNGIIEDRTVVSALGAIIDILPL